ncbi:uncharacterized protein TNCV_3052991 [Trichonephila clavipes]|nr:uncharacterized protein TNCV_3052991 [Trichonephila clavipes]
MTTCIPGILLQQFQSGVNHDLHTANYITRQSWAMEQTDAAFSASDTNGVDLKSRDLDESPDPSMSKIVLRIPSISSKILQGGRGKRVVGSYYSRKEGTELVDGTVATRVDVLGKVIPRRAIEDKLSKLVKTSISVDGKLVHALLDSGTEITVIKKDFVPGISVEGASTIYLKGIFRSSG